MTNSGPTPSTTSNQLIQLAQSVMAGAAAHAELASMAAGHMEGLERARQDFVTRLGHLNLPPSDTLQAAVDEVLASFRDYHGSLEALSAGGDLNQAITLLMQATHRMLQALAMYELQELHAVGPTASPYVNLLMRLAHQLEIGAIESAAYLAAIGQAAASTAHGYAPLLAQLEAEKAEEVAALRQADAEHSAAIEVFNDFPRRRDNAVLKDAALRLEQAMASLGSVMQQAAMRRLASGPSRSPHVNILRNTLGGFAARAVPLASWQNAVDGFARVLRDTQAQVEEVSALGATVPLDEERQVLQDSVADMEMFVKELEACQEPDAAPALLERFDTFSAAVDRSLDTFEAVREKLVQAGLVMCPRCQRFNAPGAAVCERCHAELATASPRGMPIPPSLRTLLLAVNDIATGNMTPDAFELAVNNTQQIIDTNESDTHELAEKQRARVRASDLDAEQQETALAALEHQLDAVVQASTAIREGLQRMRAFLMDHDKERLQDAVRRVYQGYHLLYEVHQAAQGPLSESVFQVSLDSGMLTVASSDDYSVTVSADDDEDGRNISNLLKGIFD